MSNLSTRRRVMPSEKHSSLKYQGNKTAVFRNLVFVVSNTEDKLILNLIKNHGGKVQKSLTKKTDYFVQGYNTDDDDRLGEAGDKDIRVVSPEYIDACVKSGMLLDINVQALGPVGDRDGFPSCMHSPAVLDRFSPPSTECREREELPQSFGEFLQMERYAPCSDRETIYVLPLNRKTESISGAKRLASGEIKAKTGADLKETVVSKVAEFLGVFFCLPVKLLPELKIRVGKNKATLEAGKYNYSITVHRSPKQTVRLDAMETIAALEELRPEDGFCILGVTVEDICENPDDPAPLLGRANGDQAGILSTCHHQRAIGSPPHQERSRTGQTDPSPTLQALFNTAAHETMHMFGLDHCAYYSCVMNSWSDPVVSPEDHPEKVAPLHLCPIDLRKLQHSIGFDSTHRYRKLLEFYERFRIKKEVTWIQGILELILKEQG